MRSRRVIPYHEANDVSIQSSATRLNIGSIATTTHILVAVHAERLNRHRTQVLIVALSLLNDLSNVLELRLRQDVVELGLSRLLVLGGHLVGYGQGYNKRKEGIEDHKG